MNQAELIYSVEDIFTSCLHHYHDAQYFYIAPYQRGYKWGSGENEAVMRLVKDIYKSFSSTSPNQQQEYYLQYVTLKPVKIESQKYYLEVIDGQQRLTTLSVLLAVINNLDNQYENFSNNKISYALSKSFLSNWIYNHKISTLLSYESWDRFIDENKEEDKQDVFYLFQAAHAMNKFITDVVGLDNLKAFFQHLSDNIKLIVNAVESHIDSERVFRNLNSNKVPLTEAELVKALLITKAARGKDEFLKSKRFKEIMDIRSALGRQWDEIQINLNEPSVKSVFFPKQTDVMQGLLQLTALSLKYERQDSVNEKYPLFEFFQNQIQENSYLSADIFFRIVLIYKLIMEWYKDDTIFNALGFLFYNKNKKYSVSELLHSLLSNTINNNFQLQKDLNTKILEHKLFSNLKELKEFNYIDDYDLIHDILLLINLFPLKLQRFNFAEFESKKWTLEHIFPQNPKLADEKLTEDDIKLLKDIVDNPGKWSIIEPLLNKSPLNEKEVELFNELLKANTALLNNIGNMALLPLGENAGLGNKLFNKKREKICEQISDGSFVPSHTFNLFSKLILPKTEQLKFWSKNDIENHQQYIHDEIVKIKTRLER